MPRNTYSLYLFGSLLCANLLEERVMRDPSKAEPARENVPALAEILLHVFS